MTAYDGLDIPHSSQESESAYGKHVIVDKYLDENLRKRLLMSSNKDKQRLFREKRQHFEKHRKDNERGCLSDDAGDFEDKHKIDLTLINPLKIEVKKPKQMLTKVSLPRRKDAQEGKPDYLE